MSAYHRNYGYEEDPDYPDYWGSQNGVRRNLETRNYSDPPGPLNNPDYHGARRNPYSEDSRTNSDNPGFEPDYPGSQSYPNSPGTRNNPYSAGSRKSSGYHGPFSQPDYPGSQSNPYQPGSPREPDYAESQWKSNGTSSGNTKRYTDSRTNPDYLDSMAEPDYPGAQGHSNHPGSRRNSEYARSRIIDALGEPDYPGAENRSKFASAFEDPDYPGAENYRKSPNFWGEPDYPNAEHLGGYGSSDTREMTREVLRKTAPFQPSFHGEGGYPESFEMGIIDVADPHGYSEPDGPRSSYENPAFVGDIIPGHAFGSAHLPGHNWQKSPQVQKLISFLTPMTSRDRVKAIRNQPMTMEEKRTLRKMVDKEKSKQTHRSLEFSCCAQCVNSISMAYRRSRNSLSELLSSFSLWQKTLKVIGGKFGTSILSYFNFLRWLLKFNIFSFVVTFSFIIIPQLTVAEKNTLWFTGLEFLTGAGYFSQTVMYYGFYTNSTIQHGNGGAAYNMQLAYIFTVAACLVACFFSLLFSMARYFRNNFINPHIYSRGIAKLIFCWDFTVTHDSAVKLKQKNLSTEIRENLSEIRQENVKLTLKQQLVRLSAHLAAWFVSSGVAVGCCVAVYYLAENNSEFLKNHRDPGAVLLLPFVVSCMNLAVPRFYSMFRLVERYELPRHEVYTLLIRNIFLKISIIGILCYYWLNVVALAGEECWETLIGQEIYRLLLMDFVFSLADSLLGEFLRRIIGMRFITSLGVQEFDIARNVLELIYAQTLVWIGTFFSPLLPFIQIITLFIMFYVKNITLMMNFQPPSKAWRASQMMTFFIFLLFFPSFTGVLCTLAITIWRLKPSANCGPFRGLPSFIQSIYSWIDTLSKRPSYLWVVWIYRNLIGSVHFFFILTLIVLIITYLYWQITEGRKIMIRLLHEQIINEGKDKMFLIEKLLKLQEAEKRNSPSPLSLERRNVEHGGSQHSREDEAAYDLRFRRPAQEDNSMI